MSETEGITKGAERPLILVVEDDVDILSFIAMELMEDYRVLKAVDGQEGLELALEHVPDLIITDLMMPVMGGLELCRELKENSATSHIPVIMLTAKTSQENQLEGLKIGADDYVMKPFNIVLLQARISNLLESRRLLCERFMERALTQQHFSGTEPVQENSFMDELVSILKTRYEDWGFSADDFAAAAGMSLRTLQRKLKAVVDRSPAEFITYYRMQKACELLEHSDKSITEIAFAVGYDESSSFSRVFKRSYSMSPSEYRASKG